MIFSTSFVKRDPQGVLKYIRVEIWTPILPIECDRRYQENITDSARFNLRLMPRFEDEISYKVQFFMLDIVSLGFSTPRYFHRCIRLVVGITFTTQ
jgi:hypothetical protein